MQREVQRRRRGTLLFAAIALSLAGCQAKPPGAVETTAMSWIKLHVTVGGKKNRNPLSATPKNIADGQQLFASYCMVCHGKDAQNTGVPFAGTLSPPVPSLASAQVQAYSDGQLKWIIENGLSPSGMPPSKGEFSNDDMWAMVLYIRHLPPKGSLGEPAVYSGQ
jgi:mono/diheme cytochrome c family protein